MPTLLQRYNSKQLFSHVEAHLRPQEMLTKFVFPCHLSISIEQASCKPVTGPLLLPTKLPTLRLQFSHPCSRPASGKLLPSEVSQLQFAFENLFYLWSKLSKGWRRGQCAILFLHLVLLSPPSVGHPHQGKILGERRGPDVEPAPTL